MGTLAYHAGLFGHRDVERAMDNLWAAAAGMRRRHSDVLPFPMNGRVFRETFPKAAADSSWRGLARRCAAALGISVSEAARGLRISRQMLHNVLNGKASITPEMALRIGKFCGHGPALWLRRQQARDLWEAERRLAAEISRMPTRFAGLSPKKRPAGEGAAE